MKGYFSRLIRQTGITSGTGEDFAVSGQMPRATESEAHNDPAPIHVEERNLVEPGIDPAPENLVEGRGDDSQSSIADIRAGDMEYFRVERFENEIAGKPQRGIPQGEEPALQMPPMQKPMDGAETTEAHRQLIEPLKSGIYDRDHPALLEKPPSGTKNGPKKMPRNFKDAATANKESDQAFLFEPPAKPDDSSDEKEAWSSTLKKVREWVAGTPIPGSQKLPGRKGFKGQNRHEGPPDFSGEKQGQALLRSSRSPTPSRQKAEPETRDYHLSIGTVSLTVEGPREDSSRQRPPERAKGGPPGSEAVGSRLSRHYIRI